MVEDKGGDFDGIWVGKAVRTDDGNSVGETFGTSVSTIDGVTDGWDVDILVGFLV